MGYLYFDESIREKGDFIIGALVYSACDLTPLVRQEWESLGLDSSTYEYKSSAPKAGDANAHKHRFRLHSLLSQARLGLVVSPISHRKELGTYAVALLEQLLETGCIPREHHVVYLDQNIEVSKIIKASADAKGITIHENQNSLYEAGIQLADLAAHSLGGMLLEAMGLLNKSVSGDVLRYDADTMINIGFELWASLRYLIFCNPSPVKMLVGFPIMQVQGYGLYIPPSCSDALKEHAIARFGENYLGCIH